MATDAERQVPWDLLLWPGAPAKRLTKCLSQRDVPTTSGIVRGAFQDASAWRNRPGQPGLDGRALPSARGGRGEQPPPPGPPPPDRGSPARTHGVRSRSVDEGALPYRDT